MTRGKRKRRIVQLSDGVRVTTLTTRYRFALRYPKRRYDRRTGIYYVLEEETPLWCVRWADLLPEQRSERQRAFAALSEIRKQLSATEADVRTAAQNHGLTVEQLQAHVGKNLWQDGEYWRAKIPDDIERERWFFSNGERVSIIIRRARDASLISKYCNAVQRAKDQRNPQLLMPYKNLSVTDVYSKVYSFETDLNAIYRLHEQIEPAKTRQQYQDKY